MARRGLVALPQDGFRVPRPLHTVDGRWMTDGWTAWTYVECRHATAEDVPACIDAVRAFHRMLLVMSEFGDFDDWEASSEKRAADLLLTYLRVR